MQDGATAGKLPDSVRFLDLSDYARPVAVRLAQVLRDTSVRAPHVTLAWAIIGLAGAYGFTHGDYTLALLGAVAMQAKNILDAADGSLARLQNRPSRIGRFLDSLFDYLVALALCGALAVVVSRGRPAFYAVILASGAFILGLLQGSVFNYFYVLFRRRRGGDTTSHVQEALTREDRARYRDRPGALASLRVLIWAYNWIYGWQDRLVQRIDRWAAAPLLRVGRDDIAAALRDDSHLMTAVSALGPGLMILVLDLYTIAGIHHLSLALELFLWTVVLGGTFYAAAIFVRLRITASRLAGPRT
jgi:hypothetical protein